MTATTDSPPSTEPSFDVVAPREQTIPVVLASPHSGRVYPRDFLAESRLDPVAIRKSEDSYVDEIFGLAPAVGAPLLRAHFPRAYLDPNREPYELDPQMFEDALPAFVNARSPRVAAGLGTIARIVSHGEDIYRGKLRFEEAERRIATLYRPYHRMLQSLIETTRARFGRCLLIDCHSMPSVGGPMDIDTGVRRVDFVLGDCHGTSCAPAITDTTNRFLRRLGYVVTWNNPYSGGYTTRHYGAPHEGVHTLQIEINRAIYMNEGTMERLPHLDFLSRQMRDLVVALADTLQTLGDRP